MPCLKTCIVSELLEIRYAIIEQTFIIRNREKGSFFSEELLLSSKDRVSLKNVEIIKHVMKRLKSNFIYHYIP